MGAKGAAKGACREESVAVPEQTEEVKAAAPRKRNPCPGLRSVGGRIYDPENGKTCHQVSTYRRPTLLLYSRSAGLPWPWINLIDSVILMQCRQKTTDFAVSCKQPQKRGLCPIHFCHKCLLNR